MGQLSNQVVKLAINSNVFMQYFLRTNKDELFKSQLIAVTNFATPTISQINDHSFEVTKRIKTDSRNVISFKYAAVSLATKVERSANSSFSVKSNFKGNCVRYHSMGNGVDSNHKLFKCPKFTSPESKVSKLEELGGCKRCSQLNHKNLSCKFDCKWKCGKYNEFHYEFLCTHDGSKNSDASS